MSDDKKKIALDLIDQLIAMENTTDADYVKLLAEKKIYRMGESAITFHLKILKDLTGGFEKCFNTLYPDFVRRNYILKNIFFFGG